MIEIAFDTLVLQFPESTPQAIEYINTYGVGELVRQEMDRRGLNIRDVADIRSFYEPIQEALATHSSSFVRIAAATGDRFYAELRGDTIFNLLHDSDPRVRAAILRKKGRIPKAFDRVKRPQIERMFSELLASQNDEVLTIAAGSDYLPKFLKSNPAVVEKLLLEAPLEMVTALIAEGQFQWDVLSRVADRGDEFALVVMQRATTDNPNETDPRKVSLCRRLAASSDVAIRAEVARDYLFQTSDEFRKTAERWLRQEPIEVARGVLEGAGMFEPSFDLKLVLDCAGRSDEFALAVAETVFTSSGHAPDAGRAELLQFLTQHPSVAVREIMAKADFLSRHGDLRPIVAPLLKILAQDQNVDVAQCAEASLDAWGLRADGTEPTTAGSDALEGLVESGDVEEILSLLSTVVDLDAVGGREAAESAFAMLMESNDTSLRVRAAEMSSVVFFDAYWERLLADDDRLVVDGFLSNGELFQQLPTAILLTAAKRSDAMAIRVAEAYGQCAESLNGGNKLLKFLQKHQSVDVRRALAKVFHSDLPLEGWRVLAKDKDGETAELAKQSLAELTADN